MCVCSLSELLLYLFSPGVFSMRAQNKTDYEYELYCIWHLNLLSLSYFYNMLIIFAILNHVSNDGNDDDGDDEMRLCDVNDCLCLSMHNLRSLCIFMRRATTKRKNKNSLQIRLQRTLGRGCLLNFALNLCSYSLFDYSYCVVSSATVLFL